MWNFPQIIILQLESFFDPLKLKGVELSQDPIPTFRELMQEGRSGQLHVPTFGGGTAKTEFSVLTSMNAELLKPGEIPHNSFLKNTPIESHHSYTQLEYNEKILSLNMLNVDCKNSLHNYESVLNDNRLSRAVWRVNRMT